MIFGRRRRHLVRVHFVNADPSLEGVLVGRYGGHYILASPRVIESESRSHSLDGDAHVPAERVLFLQVLAEEPRS